MASLATKPVEGGDPHGQEHSLHQHYFHHYSGLHLSRLSMCTKGEITTACIDIDDADDKHYDGDDDYDNDNDDQDDHDNEEEEVQDGERSSNTSPPDSDNSKEAATTPRRRWRWMRRRRGGLKEYYASENEAQQQKKGINKEIMKRRGWMERAAAAGIVTRYGDDDNYDNSNHLIINNSSRSTGESECFVITRPKGGRRSLCMDLEEVKACRDLGLELDRISLMSMSPTNSTIDYYTSCSGGNSPIASLGRISPSPGDDPRDVKARLKTWAQMVALATATR